MVMLTREGLKDPKWKEAGVRLPQFNLEEMIKKTKAAPIWVHIAPSNLYIGEIAPLQQTLLELGVVQEGIIGIETWDEEIVDKIYRPHDNLRLRIIIPPQGDSQITVVASTADTIFANANQQEEWKRALEYFAKPSLQMVTITCTEKGYRIRDQRGKVLKIIAQDIQNGPARPGQIIS